MSLSRRSLLRSGGAVALAAALGPEFWRAAYGAPVTTAPPAESPYGPLGPADANGLRLPPGFTGRVIGVHGTAVAGTGYLWHVFPDGGATFPMDDGGWVYASNSETDQGGVGAIRFDRNGAIVDAYRILDGTRRNCAGGPTPWGTWLSCEEVDDGQVWECAVDRAGQGEVRPALGTFKHEAVAVDPELGRLYLTEDTDDGRLWRFTPSAYPDLSAGELEVALVDATGTVRWVADPAAGTSFDGGEGIWYDGGWVYFTTKGDDHVRAVECATDRLQVVYDGTGSLRGVDNITASASGDLYVAEEGDDLELVMITAAPERLVAPFARVVRAGHAGSEVTGPAFSPDGTRLYFSSQRGPEGGVTFEVSGPFRRPAPPSPPPDESGQSGRSGGPGRSAETDGEDLSYGPALAGGAAAVGTLTGLLAVRRRPASE